MKQWTIILILTLLMLPLCALALLLPSSPYRPTSGASPAAGFAPSTQVLTALVELTPDLFGESTSLNSLSQPQAAASSLEREPIREALRGYVEVAGRILIGDIRAEIHTTHGADCGCSPPLWNGGIVTTPADLSTVQIGDWADIRTLDGGHYVCECVEIMPCMRLGKWLIGWRGVVKAEGDIIVYSGGRAYRFVRL